MQPRKVCVAASYVPSEIAIPHSPPALPPEPIIGFFPIRLLQGFDAHLHHIGENRMHCAQLADVLDQRTKNNSSYSILRALSSAPHFCLYD